MDELVTNTFLQPVYLPLLLPFKITVLSDVSKSLPELLARNPTLLIPRPQSFIPNRASFIPNHVIFLS